MPLRINAEAPDFAAEMTHESINCHDWISNSWAILSSHSKDFTPVGMTELGYMAGLKPEFDQRDTKIPGLSVDPVGSHGQCARDIEEMQGHKTVTSPIIGDPELNVAKLHDMLPAEAADSTSGWTAADNVTVPSVFRIGPDKGIKAILTYLISTNRNFDDVLRLLDPIQLTAKHSVATPVNRRPGQDVIIPLPITDRWFAPNESALIKLMAIENAVRAVELAASLAGNHAHAREFGERHIRDVRSGRVQAPQADAAAGRSVLLADSAPEVSFKKSSR